MKYKYSVKSSLSPKNSNGCCSVRLRVSSNSKRVDLHTGIVLKENQWKNGRVKQGCSVNGIPYNLLNDQLRKQEDFIAKFFTNCMMRDEIADLGELKQQFNYQFKSNSQQNSQEFFYLLDKYIADNAQTRSWTASYYNEWTRVRNSLYNYQQTTSWNSFNETYLNGYLQHLANTMLNEKIKEYIKKLREFLRWARSKRYPVNDIIFDWNPKLQSSKKQVRFLYIKEIERLISLNTDKIALQQTRDMFLFQCFTGLRFSDLQKLKKSHITQREDGAYSIEILTKKDVDRVSYKLPKQAALIYEKYRVYEYDNNMLLPVPTNQTYNDHLKELGELIDLQGVYTDYECRLSTITENTTPRKDIQSHDARRTFIVTALNEGVDVNVIALITSHSDIKVMMPYIKLHQKGTDKVIDAIDAIFETM